MSVWWLVRRTCNVAPDGEGVLVAVAIALRLLGLDEELEGAALGRGLGLRDPARQIVRRLLADLLLHRLELLQDHVALLPDLMMVGVTVSPKLTTLSWA